MAQWVKVLATKHARTHKEENENELPALASLLPSTSEKGGDDQLLFFILGLLFERALPCVTVHICPEAQSSQSHI